MSARAWIVLMRSIVDRSAEIRQNADGACRTSLDCVACLSPDGADQADDVLAGPASQQFGNACAL